VSKFKPSYRGIGVMLRSEFMQAAMEARAERVKLYAEFLAPVDADPDDQHRGLYKASFEVESGVRAGRRGGRTRRAYGRSTSSTALLRRRGIGRWGRR
jgi:hypothetical protein